MEQKYIDAMFYNLKELRGAVNRIENDRQYDTVELNKKLDNLDKKLDLVLQRTNMLEKPSVFSPERLYREHENGVSYQMLANKSGLSVSQVRTRISNYKKKVAEDELLEGFEYE